MYLQLKEQKHMIWRHCALKITRNSSTFVLVQSTEKEGRAHCLVVYLNANGTSHLNLLKTV